MNLPATRYEWEKCSRTVLLSGVAGGSASLEVEAGGCVDDVERVVRCRVVHSRLVAPETVAVELADIASARKLIDLLSDTSSLRALPERLRGLRPVWSPGSLEDGSFVPVDPAAEAVDDAAAPAACDADGFPIPTPRWVAFPTLAWVQRRRALEQQRLREAQEEELLRARAAAQTQRLRVVVPGFVAAGAIGADGVVREAAAAEAPCRTASVVSPSGTAAHVASPVDVASAAVAEAAAAAAASPEETQKRSRAEAALVVNEEEAARRKRARVEQQNRQRETALEEESAEETRRQERERLRQSEELQQQNEALLAKLQRQQQEKQEKKDKERAEREVAKLAKAEERRQRQEYLDFSKRVQQQQQKQRRTRRSGGGGGGSSAPYDKEVERAFEKQIRLDLPGSTDALVERSRVQYRHYREVVCAVVMHLRRLPAAALEDPQPHLGLLAEYLKLAGVYAAEVIDNLPSLLPRLLDASPSKAFPRILSYLESAWRPHLADDHWRAVHAQVTNLEVDAVDLERRRRQRGKEEEAREKRALPHEAPQIQISYQRTASADGATATTTTTTAVAAGPNLYPQSQQQAWQPQQAAYGTPCLPPDWQQFFDPSSNRPYYVNMRTRQTSWVLPSS